MKTTSFNWQGENQSLPLRVCISDKLGPLLPHSHNEIELMFFYNTSCCEYLCNGKKILFSSNEMLVVNSGEIHSCTEWGTDCEVACVFADMSMFSAVSLKHITCLNKIADNRLVSCFEKLKNVIFDDGLNFGGKECKIYSILYEIFAVLLGYSIETSYNTRRQDINNILRFIDANLSNNITVEMMAKKCHLSKDRFFHVFKEYTGDSPIGYILKQRIKRACGLLKNSDMSIQEIALECNFCTSSYFSKKFFDYMLISPSEYRKSISTGEKVDLNM